VRLRERRRWLLLTIILDSACVTAVTISAFALSVRLHTVSESAFGYAAVAAVGLALAALAERPLFRTATVPAVAVHRAVAIRGILLITGGLVLNTVGCVVILALSRPDEPKGANPVGLSLLIGGDALSVVYLVLFATWAHSSPRSTKRA
jgi:hypothetical protein